MMNHAPRRVSMILLGAALAVSLSACTSDSKPAQPSVSTSPTPVEPPLATTVKVGKITGRLRPAAAETFAVEVGVVVDGWLDAAYVGGDYPRAEFTDAFPGFTEGAAAEAGKDRQLMSNADIGARIESAVATRRVVVVDVLAAKRKPRAATARFRLVFDTTGELEKQVSVSGRLMLTRHESGWQIFAYDVAKGSK